MIADLKPYPTYRPAEGKWLGEIPSHWTVRRMKYVVRETDSRSSSGKEQLLRISQYTGVTQRSRADGLDEPDTRADSLVGYKRVEPNDLVINIMLAWNGSMGVSRYSGIASPAYCVYRFGCDVHPWYCHNLLRSPAYKARIKASSTGVVESRLRLYSDDLGRIEAILPSPDEQAAIVRFLDWANGRLERAIRAKRKVIALLGEQKQAIIHRAVTRGLDPSVPLKPSGIPWLGDIPQHWETRPIKHWTKVNVRTLGQSTNHEFEFRYIDISTVRTGYLVRAPELMPFAKAPSRARRVLVAGDTIVSTVRTYLKAVWFVGQEAENLIASTGFAVFSPNPELEPEYLHHVLQDASFVDQVTANSIGVAYPGIAETVLARFRVAIPPSRNEQRDVIAAIKKQTQPLTVAISRLEREIELLREYRTRLVADVVTGKLDVREAAAGLPDEAPLDSIEDDAELGDETETADEEAAV
ncbi:MAG TPA: restriction endonuclease subunit S [Dissulfurispiraceae bacterium]|nr:restriction endonuclease subunit S [Dissulfurispiraceae bacterium]